MGTKWIENTGENPMFVGGKMIPPGEGKLIDEAALPPEHRAPAEDAAPVAEAPGLDDLVRELLKKPVRQIVADLNGLKQEALERALVLESLAQAPRSTLVNAINGELLDRANERLFQEQVEAAYQQQLAALTPEQRAALGEEGEAELREKAAEAVKAAG